MSDVLILGGGLAGAASALLLADQGISATIVEARSRLGGRAFTRGMPGDDGPPVEYGGGWGHAAGRGWGHAAGHTPEVAFHHWHAESAAGLKGAKLAGNGFAAAP